MILSYRDMAGDVTRVTAFQRAINAVVRPGDVVVEIGTGLGTYAIFACQAGARKVYAIDCEDIILTARQVAQDNGCTDRIRFIRGDALSVSLPEKADVLIMEDFSPSMVDPEPEQLIRHAWSNFLKPKARVIPATLSLYAAPVHCPHLYARLDQWAASNQQAYGIDFSATRDMVMNLLHRARFKPDACTGLPKVAHRFDLKPLGPMAFDVRLKYRARAGGLVHGIGLWFDGQLAPRIGLSNAPEKPATLWGQAFLPLAQPISVLKQTMITVDLAARFARHDRVWWQWQMSANRQACDGSTFRSFPTSLNDLEAASREAAPGLSSEGQITEHVLRHLNSGSRIIEVAKLLRERFPKRFPTAADALACTGEIARRFGRRPSV